MSFPGTEGKAGKGDRAHMCHCSTPTPATAASRQWGSPGQQVLLLFSFLNPPQGLLMEGGPELWVGSGICSLPGQPVWFLWTSPSHPSAQPGLGARGQSHHPQASKATHPQHQGDLKGLSVLWLLQPGPQPCTDLPPALHTSLAWLEVRKAFQASRAWGSTRGTGSGRPESALGWHRGPRCLHSRGPGRQRTCCFVRSGRSEKQISSEPSADT